MTLAQDIIKGSLLKINAIDVAEGVEAVDADMALDVLNRMLRAMRGNGIGGRLVPTSCSTSTTAQSGRLYEVDTTAGVISLTLPSDPREGARVGVNDAKLNFGTNKVILVANGRLVSNAASNVNLNVDGMSVAYFFRADGGWELERDLALTDDLYLSEDLDEAVIDMLAGRLAISYAQNPTDGSVTLLAKYGDQGRKTIERRYGRRGRNQADPSISIITPNAPQRAPTL